MANNYDDRITIKDLPPCNVTVEAGRNGNGMKFWVARCACNGLPFFGTYIDQENALEAARKHLAGRVEGANG